MDKVALGTFCLSPYVIRRVKDRVNPRTGHSFCNLGARWEWMVNATPRLLYPPRKTRYPFYRAVLDGSRKSYP
jgi:hypothetical protein